ncbi:MAG: DNA repair exonuclease [Lachnospiraceae bacterium]|nr:DNA repair exonuclease [Lachnospiraceae bacterium]
MEFIHISDVHFGMELKHGGKGVIRDALLEVVDVCNQRGSDLLLVSGDLFHSIPDIKQLKEIDYIFSKLLYTKTVIIAGNHDYMARGGVYEDYQFESNTYVIKGDNECVKGEVLGINADIYGVSYSGMYMKEKKDKEYFESKYELDADKVNILLLHGGTKDQLDIDFRAFVDSKFDYVALGHIHKRDMLGDNVAYAGSLVALDHTETGEHGFVVGNVDEMSSYPGKRTKLVFVNGKSRKYEDVTIELNQYMTTLGIKERIISRLCDDNTCYTLRFTGICTHGKVVFDEEVQKDALNLRELLEGEPAFEKIVGVVDATRTFVDINEIYLDNTDNIIGQFISSVHSLEEDEDMKELVMEYGILALME